MTNERKLLEKNLREEIDKAGLGVIDEINSFIETLLSNGNGSLSYIVIDKEVGQIVAAFTKESSLKKFMDKCTDGMSVTVLDIRSKSKE